MRRAFVYRLYPTKKQAVVLVNHLDATRHLYNSALDQRKTTWEKEQRSVTVGEQAKLLPAWKADLQLPVSAHVCQETLKRLDLAYKAFFRRLKAGEAPGFPRFKGRDRWDSLVFKEYGNSVKLVDGRLRIFGVGHLKVKLHRSITGTIKTVTLKRSGSRWSAIFSCDAVPARAFPQPTSPEVGIDMGLTVYAKLSTGEAIENPRWYRQTEEKLAAAQQKLSKKAKGTSARRKARQVVTQLYEKAREQRRDFQHKLALQLVNTYGFIAVEALQVKDMVESGSTGLSKSIADAAWARFLAILSAKAAEAGRSFVMVPPRGTSSTCSGCGLVRQKELWEREHRCECGLVLDRDHNAALNILRLGRSRLVAA